MVTNDGANIYIRTYGSRQPDSTIFLHANFETGSEDYFWLNYVVAVGILKAGTGYVTIDMYNLVA
jgi:hypothetical protein